MPLWLKYALIIKDERILKAAERANQKTDKVNELAYREVIPSTIGLNKNTPNSTTKDKPMNGEIAMLGGSGVTLDHHPHNFNSHHHHHHHVNYQPAITTSQTTTSPQKNNNNNLLFTSKVYSPSNRMMKTLLVSSSSVSSRHNQLHHRNSGGHGSNEKLKPKMSSTAGVGGFDNNESGDEAAVVITSGVGVVAVDGAGASAGTTNSIERDELAHANVESSTGGVTDWLQMRENLGKILKLLRRSVYILERNRLRQKVIKVI